jgi:hypothetical protein
MNHREKRQRKSSAIIYVWRRYETEVCDCYYYYYDYSSYYYDYYYFYYC